MIDDRLAVGTIPAVKLKHELICTKSDGECDGDETETWIKKTKCVVAMSKDNPEIRHLYILRATKSILI